MVQRGMQSTHMRTRAVYRVYRWGYHHGVLRVQTRVRCADGAEEYAIRFVRVTLLVVAQVSADGLGEAGAKNEASPRPAEPTKARAPRAAGPTRAAQRGGCSGSLRSVPAPHRSAPLTSAHDRTNLPVAFRCSGGSAAAASRTMWPLRVRSHSYYPSVSTPSTRRSCTAPERIPRVPCAAVSHICHKGRCKLLRVKPHATAALNQAQRGYRVSLTYPPSVLRIPTVSTRST